MSHAVGSISLHLFRLLVFLPATFGFLQGHSQSISTTPSADCSTCDGALVVTTSLAGNCFYVIADAGGNNVASDFTAAGSVSFNALCAGFYSVTVSNGSENESSVINIPVAGFNPGAAAEETLCSNGTNFNLAGDIAGFVPGGTWTDPAGNALSSAVIDPSNAIEGVYQYSVLQGGCQVSTGVAVTLLQSANPGLSTTYLICETYAPFNLIDHLAGDPDAGGQWFLPGAVPMGGVFDPSTMNSTLFTYMIDNNDGCPPVFSTMMVVENLLPDPGDDTSVLMCDDSGPQSMFSMLEGSPTAGGSWYDVNDNAFPPNFDPSWMPEGIYRYHVSGATPCPGQDAFLTIGVVPASPSGENVSVNFCETDAQVDAFTLLGGSPLPGGSWTDSNGNATTHVIDPSTGAGTWIYTYPSVGCAQDFAEITVNVEALPNSGTATPSEICVSAITIDLNNLLSADATAGGTWFDENGFMVSPGVTIDGPGNFQWQYVTNGLVCPDDEAWYEVAFVNAPVAPSQLNFSVCANSPVNLNDLAGTSAGTTLWTDNLGLPVLPDQNLAADATYVASIASGNVCPDISVPLSIEVETPGFIPMNYNFEICSSGSLVNLESFVAGIDYTSGTWTSGGNTVSNLVSESALPGTFVFEDNSSVACAPAQLTLVINATLPANAGPDVSESVCDSSAPFSLNDLLGNGTDTGGNWWKEGLALTSDLIDPLLTSGGLYQYIVDGNGPCVADTAVVQLNVIPSPIADAGLDQEVCSGSAGFSIGSAPDADCTYTWTPGDFLDNAEVSNPEVINVPQTESSLQLTYVLTVTNNNCTSTDTAQITVRPNPVAVLVGTPDVCLGDEAFFEVAGGIPTSWTPVNLF
ncbi:MAG: hypothetical protein JNM00_01520, partial [Flavobacteriales bacterium]|nr:hypothetical protein [Flavobacteriales bacterium]